MKYTAHATIQVIKKCMRSYWYQTKWPWFSSHSLVLVALRTCSSQGVAHSVYQRIRRTLAKFTRNYAQIDELLTPLSTFLQAALIKQVLADYSINPTNTTSKSDPILERQINQICEAIFRFESKNGQLYIAQIIKTLKQILLTSV